MKLGTLKQHLQSDPDKPLGFVFSDGDVIPRHFHVTEVGHVAKNFIDCGGTVRNASTVQLQVWLGNDEEHRLTAGKLAGILDLAKRLIPSDELEVEVEYEGCSISQFPVTEAMAADGQLVFHLGEKHTDCLAKEACGIESASSSASSCCGGKACG